MRRSMKLNPWLVVFFVLLTPQVSAQDESVDAAVEEPQLTVLAYEPQEIASEDTAESADGQAQGVWWGNRSISYGNYIRFERLDLNAGRGAELDIDAGCPGECKFCDENLVCCTTGCQCEKCEYICDDCDDCPGGYFDKIFFDLDKSVLRPEGREECDRVLAYLEAHPEKDIVIEGHTCDLASDDYNVGLGQRRARSVEQYLIEHGVNSSRIQTATYGETLPWVGLEQRELNRRAVVLVLRLVDAS